jgi:hypothetical protein
VALEIIYETSRNVEDIFDYPKMYKVYKDGDVEIDRSFAEFSLAPEESVVAYIVQFKEYVAELLSSIPDSPTADYTTERKIQTLLNVGSYLRSAIPGELPIDSEQEEAAQDAS